MILTGRTLQIRTRAASSRLRRRELLDGSLGAGLERRRALVRREADALAFLKGKTGGDRETAVADFCQVLFCLNEFLYAD